MAALIAETVAVSLRAGTAIPPGLPVDPPLERRRENRPVKFGPALLGVITICTWAATPSPWTYAIPVITQTRGPRDQWPG